jgi:hypothetical protein
MFSNCFTCFKLFVIPRLTKLPFICMLHAFEIAFIPRYIYEFRERILTFRGLYNLSKFGGGGQNRTLLYINSFGQRNSIR